MKMTMRAASNLLKNIKKSTNNPLIFAYENQNLHIEDWERGLRKKSGEMAWKFDRDWRLRKRWERGKKFEGWERDVQIEEMKMAREEDESRKKVEKVGEK